MKIDTTDSLGNKLRSLRKERKYTLEKMAHDFGTSSVSISRYESGLREPKKDTIIKLAKYFGVSIDYLYGLTDVRTPIYSDENIDFKGVDEKSIEELLFGINLVYKIIKDKLNKE